MTEYIIDSFSEQETFEAGRRLGEAAQSGEVYALSGDLGTGKTVLAKGFARGLGITRPGTSPTFTILQTYEEGRVPLCHMDIYRLEDEEELEAIGGDEYFGSRFVCLVEWAELAEGLLPPDTVRITVEKEPARGADYRRLTVRQNAGKENEA